MRTITTILLLLSFPGIATADCGGKMSNPIRTAFKNAREARPVQGLLQRIRPQRTSDCSGVPTSVPTTDCASYQLNQAVTQTTYCSPSRESLVAYSTPISQTYYTVPTVSTQTVYTVPIEQMTYTVQEPVPTSQCTFGLETMVQPTSQPQVQGQTFGLDAYSRAYQSASYRAANGIKGHVAGELVSGRRSSAGVGFATNNPNPRTCLGVPGRTSATCAVVRGADGWYSTCVK